MTEVFGRSWCRIGPDGASAVVAIWIECGYRLSAGQGDGGGFLVLCSVV